MGVPVYKDPIEVYAGDEWRIEIQFSNDDDTPIDLSSYSVFESEWRVQENNNINMMTLTVDSTNAVEGKIRLIASAEQTAQMKSKGVTDIVADGQTLIKLYTAIVEDVTK